MLNKELGLVAKQSCTPAARQIGLGASSKYWPEIWPDRGHLL